MKLIATFLVLLSFTACKQKTRGSSDKFSGCDSLAINFNTPHSNTIEKTINTTEQTAIKKIAGFIDSKPSPAYKCGYDGNILFYQNGDLKADVSFNYSGKACQHFIQQTGDSLNSTKMSGEAADFLKSLYEGKNFY